MDKTIDGSFDLNQLQDTLITEEQLGFMKLQSVKAGAETPPINVATFLDDANPTGPSSLVLVLLGSSGVDRIITEQRSRGRALIFHNVIFVASQKVDVAGFR
jgi:hypothetical protein